MYFLHFQIWHQLSFAYCMFTVDCLGCMCCLCVCECPCYTTLLFEYSSAETCHSRNHSGSVLSYLLWPCFTIAAFLTNSKSFPFKHFNSTIMDIRGSGFFQHFNKFNFEGPEIVFVATLKKVDPKWVLS